MNISDILHNLIFKPLEFFRGYGGPFILVLSILIFVHEWGHYFVARRCGVKVDKFSIGFGREIFGRTDKNGTRWKVCMIPLGGYVQMFGDSDPSSGRHVDGVQVDQAADAKTDANINRAADAAGTSENQAKEGAKDEEAPKIRAFTEEEKKVAFFAQPIYKRALIVFAGPAINYLFAILVLTGLYMFRGEPYLPAVAAAVVKDSPAEAAGIQPDDKIIGINGTSVERFDEIREFTELNINREMEVQLVHSIGKDKQGQPRWGDKAVTIKIKPRKVIETDRFGFKHEAGRIGIAGPASEWGMVEHTPLTAFGAALRTAWKITSDTLQALGQMAAGTRSTDDLGGILRIGAYAGDFAQQGVIAFITFTALLSVNLGLINILPIPLLDGGYLVMYAMEKLRGKPLTEQVQEYALRIGLVFLLGIMCLANWNDVVQLARKYLGS
jgi:regulator of sigma E protease